jgi:hypothetical protein
MHLHASLVYMYLLPLCAVFRVKYKVAEAIGL